MGDGPVRQDLSPNVAGFGRPDWVMCGCPAPGGVRLLASKDMTHAELEAQFDWGPDTDTWGFSPPVLRGQRITLTAGLKTFIVIDAPDYPSAFRALFEQWTPGPGEHAALPGIPAIEAAP
jgi:hypothetical protein